MPEETEAKSDPLRIREGRDDERQIVLHPENDDLFVRTGRQVIASCQLGISIELWLSEFHSMLEHVKEWCTEHKEQVRSSFAYPRGAKVVLFVVPAREQFDFDLADALAELNAQLPRDFNIGVIAIHQVPWGELDRFLDPERARHIYGEQPTSHRAVEA